MLITRQIINNLPTVLRIFSNNQSCASKNVGTIIQRGYILKNSSNLQNIKCMSSISSKNDNKTENVYYGVLTPQIRIVKIISFTTSIAGIAAQPILIQKISAAEGSLPIIIGLCTCVGFFTFVTPFLLHFITKKYITNLEFDPVNKKYIATVLSFFCRQKKIDFTIDDVKVPEIPGMFTTFEIKGKPLFVDPSLFTDPDHYGKLMGYDKPIDFKLSEFSKKDS